MQKLAGGLNLIKPSMVITIQTLKLYISYQRIEDKIVQFICINNENIFIQRGYNTDLIETDSK